MRLQFWLGELVSTIPAIDRRLRFIKNRIRQWVVSTVRTRFRSVGTDSLMRIQFKDRVLFFTESAAGSSTFSAVDSGIFTRHFFKAHWTDIVWQQAVWVIVPDWSILVDGWLMDRCNGITRLDIDVN